LVRTPLHGLQHAYYLEDPAAFDGIVARFLKKNGFV
jgi:hypothetical protein